MARNLWSSRHVKLASSRLVPIHGGIRVIQQRFAPVALVRVDGQTDECGDPDVVAGDHVNLRNPQCAMQRRQQLVGDRMSEPVVDRLEAVEVDEQQCQLTVSLSGGADCLLQAPDQKATVWQPGQPIVMGDTLCGHCPARRSLERLHEALVFGTHALLIPQCHV